MGAALSAPEGTSSFAPPPGAVKEAEAAPEGGPRGRGRLETQRPWRAVLAGEPPRAPRAAGERCAPTGAPYVAAAAPRPFRAPNPAPERALKPPPPAIPPPARVRFWIRDGKKNVKKKPPRNAWRK